MVSVAKDMMKNTCLLVGKIILKIPWKNLTKESIIVTIEDVYAIAGPVTG